MSVEGEPSYYLVFVTGVLIVLLGLEGAEIFLTLAQTKTVLIPFQKRKGKCHK